MKAFWKQTIVNGFFIDGLWIKITVSNLGETLFSCVHKTVAKA
jgi:hypothetical protein